MPDNGHAPGPEEHVTPEPTKNRGTILLAIGAFVAALVIGTALILAYQALTDESDRVTYRSEPSPGGEEADAGDNGALKDEREGTSGEVADYVRPTGEQALWAWAVCAILTESNGADHNIIGGAEPGTTGAARTIAGLEEWWGVTDRESLLDTLAWLEKEGHRSSFEAIGAQVSNSSAEELADIRASVESDPEVANQIEVALKYHDELGKKGILGWDYARYVMLCGWGRVAGYLTEDEALEKMMPAARRLQGTFDSWDDLGDNYLIGRQFWSLAQTIDSGAELQRTYEHLLSDPDSPWRQIPWGLDLTPPDA